jgi:choline dehydrogenase-like flavoprotein
MKPFRDALTKAWVSKGEKINEDIYSGTMSGLTHCMNTIYKGFRSSSYFFVEGKPNITILAETHSKNLIIEDGVATGVTVFGHNGEDVSFRAKKEVIVSSGVFESPKLLMLSGIGPEKELAAHGIKTIIKSEHVGQNLLDHPILAHVFRLKDGLGLDDHLLRAGPQHDGAVSAYRKNKTGPMSSGLLELVGFPRIDKYLEQSKEYVAYKKQNGGVDPFGPGGQPHFEIDFVVCIPDTHMTRNTNSASSLCSLMHSSGTYLPHQRGRGSPSSSISCDLCPVTARSSSTQLMLSSSQTST